MVERSQPWNSTRFALKALFRRDTLLLNLLVLFLLLCAIGGGASRPDVLSLLYLRPAAVVLIWVALMHPSEKPMAGARWPARLLLSAMAVMLIQLVPLPPVMWRLLPGHEVIADNSALLGVTERWLPISIAPDLTINSLLAVLPPLAVLLAGMRLSSQQRRTLVTITFGIILVSATVGIIQVTTGGVPQLYRVTSLNLPVGLFSNRNHQAVMLASGIFVARIWVAIGGHLRAAPWPHMAMAAIAVLLLFSLVIVTGSRAGTFVALLSYAAAVLLPLRLPLNRVLDSRRAMSTPGRRGWIIRYALLLMPFMLAASMVMMGRGIAIDRLFEGDTLSGGQRGTLTPVVWSISRAYLPWGAGFGTFDIAFRAAEPDSALHGSYFNHAHNDVLETALTAGIPGILLMVGAVVWFVSRLLVVVRCWRDRVTAGRLDDALVPALGAMLLFNLMLASVVDYPLRTPLMGAIGALACLWLGDQADSSTRQA